LVLKDALATLNRHKIKVLIRSKYGHITLGQTAKHGFPDVVTLHAIVNPQPTQASWELMLLWTVCPMLT